MKTFWGWMWVMVARTMNVFNATELYLLLFSLVIVVVYLLSTVQLFATPGTIAQQASVYQFPKKW